MRSFMWQMDLACGNALCANTQVTTMLQADW